jgi:hypothetical protein
MVSLVVKPVIIDRPGTYLTRCCQRVTVTEVSTKHDRGCIGTYPEGIKEGLHMSGRIFTGRESPNDIVQRVDDEPKEGA